MTELAHGTHLTLDWLDGAYMVRYFPDHGVVASWHGGSTVNLQNVKTGRHVLTYTLDERELDADTVYESMLRNLNNLVG